MNELIGGKFGAQYTPASRRKGMAIKWRTGRGERAHERGDR